jgi:Zn-dependent membrane protease YugP
MIYWDPTYFFYVFIPALVISWLVQVYLQRTFTKWSEVRNSSGCTGLQVGRQVMDAAGLRPVSIQSTSGSLTDHFDPRENVVRLSQPVANKPTVASMAVTAHELGHVQQYQCGSALIGIRNFLLPALQFSPIISYVSLLLGLIFNSTGLVWIGVCFFALMVLFTVMTLPVEFDASRRGLKMLNQAGLLNNPEDEKGTKKVLTTAALTYVAAAITSIMQLLYYVSLAQRRR